MIAVSRMHTCVAAELIPCPTTDVLFRSLPIPPRRTANRWSMDWPSRANRALCASSTSEPTTATLMAPSCERRMFITVCPWQEKKPLADSDGRVLAIPLADKQPACYTSPFVSYLATVDAGRSIISRHLPLSTGDAHQLKARGPTKYYNTQ